MNRFTARRDDRQPAVAWSCAAPMPLIGVAVGLYLSMASFNRQIEARMAESPDGFVCGDSAIPFLFLGLIGGCLGGIVAGAAVAELVTWLVRRKGRCDVVKVGPPEVEDAGTSIF